MKGFLVRVFVKFALSWRVKIGEFEETRLCIIRTGLAFAAFFRIFALGLIARASWTREAWTEFDGLGLALIALVLGGPARRFVFGFDAICRIAARKIVIWTGRTRILGGRAWILGWSFHR